MISFSIQNIRKLTGAPPRLFAIIYSLFCIVERKATTDSYEVFVLRMLTDHYLFAMFIENWCTDDRLQVYI